MATECSVSNILLGAQDHILWTYTNVLWPWALSAHNDSQPDDISVYTPDIARRLGEEQRALQRRTV